MEFCTTAIFVARKTKIQVYLSQAELASAAAKLILDIAKTRIQNKGIFRLVLAGGNTPKQSYSALAAISDKNNLDWEHVQLFWGDERMVPPDHADSNFRMVKESLLDLIAIPENNIFRMKGELSPELAAQDYKRAISSVFSSKKPAFDLVLLGLGEDGHSASIFPNSKALHESNRNVVSIYSQQQESWRLTMTLSIINRSKNILFLVSGEGKAAITAAVIEGRDNELRKYPAAQIQLKKGNIYWLLDTAAASQLIQS